MIAQHEIDSLKDGVDLAEVIQSRGIVLKKSGRSYKGFCPFHEDQKTPSLSVTPSKNLWQCFGCGAGGDVIDFIRKHDGISFKEAVARLSGGETSNLQKQPAAIRNQKSEAGGQKKKQPVKRKKTKEEPPLTPTHYKLLKRVVSFYHTAFNEDPRAMDYLQDRGITDKSIFADYRIGFANGTLLNVLPSDGETVNQLKELGILNSRGREHFYGYVTFPLLDENNNPVGMYGRFVQEEESVDRELVNHLYLPGERKGVFNRQGVKSGTEIHLTESILDALSLINAGIRNTIPCYGTNGLTADILNLLKQEQPERIHVCFDGDEAGYTGAAKVKKRLEQEGLTACVVHLPQGYDLNIFFNPQVKGKGFADPKRAYEELSMGAAGLTPPEKPAPQEEYTPLEDGFALIRDKRHYEVRAINKSGRKLKATVKGILREKGKKRFHVDTVDFYSARSRAFLVRGLADLFGKDEKIINRDMEKMIELAESCIPREQEKPEAKVITEKDKQEALRFLKNPDLLTEIITDLETIGYTGEEMNKLLCYIAAISRKMDDPLSVMIQSRSAAGKSCLQDTILSLIPEEDYIKYTRLTDQALFYQDGSLSHKILAIEELDGMNGAMYSIRTIQSSKKITIAYTGKDPVTGKMKTEENTVAGPLMVFITTTEAEIDGETASRFLFISIDESREMTEKILAKQRYSHTMEGFLGKLKGADIIRKHKNAGRLLKPLKVVNPYANLLTFTSRSLRARRDHTKYLNLIGAIAYLFQYQRKTHMVDYGGKSVEYISVTLDDIARANELAAEILGRSLDELSPPSRKLLMLIRAMCEQRAEEGDSQYTFLRRDIREYSGWSDFQVRSHIKQLEELEYIYSVTGRRGKEYVHELVARSGGEDGKPFMIGLVDMERLKEKAGRLGIVDD